MLRKPAGTWYLLTRIILPVIIAGITFYLADSTGYVGIDRNSPVICIPGMGCFPNPNNLEGINLYRTISASYDSITLTCVYGEIVIPGDDSLTIQYEGLNKLSVSDTSAQAVNHIARTVAFPVSDSTVLCAWRGLYIQNRPDSVPLHVPGNCAWVMELHDAATGGLLAVLDSAGFPRQRCAKINAFPAVFGMVNSLGSSYDRLMYDISEYCHDVESAYLQFKIVPSGPVKGCSIFDDFSQDYYRFSDNYPYAPCVSSGEESAEDILPRVSAETDPTSNRLRIVVETYRERDVRVWVRSSSGVIAKAFKTARTLPGIIVIPLNREELSPGVYYVDVISEVEATFESKRFVVPE